MAVLRGKTVDFGLFKLPVKDIHALQIAEFLRRDPFSLELMLTVRHFPSIDEPIELMELQNNSEMVRRPTFFWEEQ